MLCQNSEENAGRRGFKKWEKVKHFVQYFLLFCDVKPNLIVIYFLLINKVSLCMTSTTVEEVLEQIKRY